VANTSIGNAIMPTKLSDDFETDLNEVNGNIQKNIIFAII